MTKKLSALILLLCMALSFAVPVMAYDPPIIPEHELTPMVDSLDLIQNGSFEYTASETALTGWGMVAYESTNENFLSYIGGPVFNLNDKTKTEGEAKTQIAHTGNRAVRVTNTPPQEVFETPGALATYSNNLTQTVYLKRSDSTEGYPVEIEASVYRVGGTGGIQIALTLYKDDNSSERWEIPFTDAPVGEWTTKIGKGTIPADVSHVTMILRCVGDSEVVWDDVSFLQKCDQVFIDEVRPTEKKQPVAGTSANIFEETDGNCDFEAEQKEPWSFSVASGYTVINEDENHTPGGGQSALLKSSADIPRATAMHQIPTNIVSGATYQLEAFIKVGSADSLTFGYEIDWYVADPETGADVHTQIPSGAGYTYEQKTEDDGWYQFLHDFEAPYPPEGYDSFSSARIRLRASNKNDNAVAYLDDVSLYMIERPDVAKVYSDEAIYYTEWKEGVVSATVDEYYKEDMIGGSMRCTIVEGETELQTPEVVPFVEEDGELVASWTFPTALMQANKKGQTYKYRAEMLDSEGYVLQTLEDAIYRFDRPHYLGADGIFRKNGKEYNLGVANSCNMEWIDKGAADSGIQIVLMVGDGDYTLEQRLDHAYAHGLLVLVNLGNSHACAGSPSQIVNTKNIVNRVKEHPALFGYKLQDEPIQKGTPMEHLIAGYVAIRELDPNHAIYSDDGVYGAFWELARCTDYMDSDSYPGRNNSGQIISMTSELAEKASRGRKPFAILQKAYKNDTDTYLPNIDEFRHYAYQTLFAGSAGWGYHRFGRNDGGEPFMGTAEWYDVVAWEESGEQDMMYDCFVNGKYPMLNAYEDDNVMWQLYAADDALYAFVVNRRGSVASVEENPGSCQTVNIPLTDASLGKNLGGFSATCKWGPAARVGNGVEGENTLSVTINDFTAEVWEITLTEPVDFSAYKTVKYNDIADAPWAYQAVARLQADEILNEETALRFAPLEMVTRGEIGMFLVRALELTADTVGTFSDVSPMAEYYRELGIGKTLGIFEAEEGNLFRPEESVTREDIITMAASALRHAGAITEEGAGVTFGDDPSLPDWAVLDTASYLHTTFLREKREGRAVADEYVTRAAAAVIIDRVRQWKVAAEEPGTGDFVTGYANWLSADEAAVLWDAFLDETKGSTNAAGLWDRMIAAANGNTYWLIANVGDATQSTWARCHTFAARTAILQSKGVSAYVEDGAKLHATLPPGTVAVYRLASTTTGHLMKNGLYLAAYEDGATVSFANGEYGAWYSTEEGEPFMVRLLQNGEEITGLASGDTLKFFSLRAPYFNPEGRAIEYEKEGL